MLSADVRSRLGNDNFLTSPIALEAGEQKRGKLVFFAPSFTLATTGIADKKKPAPYVSDQLPPILELAFEGSVSKKLWKDPEFESETAEMDMRAPEPKETKKPN